MEHESRAKAQSDRHDHSNLCPCNRPSLWRDEGHTRVRQWLRHCCIILVVANVHSLIAQGPPQAVSQEPTQHMAENAQQVAGILGISQLLSKTQSINSQHPCEAAATVEELSMRQDILETVVASSLEVDGVLAELDNERAHLSELSAALQARRDHTLQLTNVANLITGTGLGIAVNAMQFSDATATAGDALGVASGIGATLLSIIGIRQQRGPQHSVGRIPNMLAPLFGRQPALNSYYPPAVLEYLGSVPPGQAPDSGSRLDQLMAEWKRVGRLGPTQSPKSDQKIVRLTSSLDTKTKLSIDDLSDRVAMLGDVTGRVGLMKRDLAELMLFMRGKRNCGS